MSDATMPASDAPAPAPALRIRRRRPVLAALDRPFGLGFALTLGGLAAFALGVALTSLSTILIYITLAIFIALGLDPVVKRLERHGMSRARAIAVVFGVFLVILVVVIVFVLPPALRQIGEFARSIPDAILEFQASAWYRGFEAQIGDVVGTALDQLAAFFADPRNLLTVGGGVLAVGFGIGNAISGVLIVVVLTLYFLASLTAFQAAFYRLAPARDRSTVAELTETITDSVGAYLIGMVVLAACNAAFSTILHVALGLPFPAFMGLAAFLITLIPLIGPATYWVIASIVALFTSPVVALIFAVLYLIYMQFEAYLLTPRVMNKAIAVPGALVIIGALVGGTLLGLLGALVSIPVAAAILLVIKQVLIPRQDAKT
ncbi:AI-2E family transporter [Microbacterium sp. LWO12-1.2]|uniref:AI-2E family transporter n=1 Tax=Microbacterium sp. LWO12-1.2 TaxID=3135261 RepID=UPI00343DB553